MAQHHPAEPNDSLNNSGIDRGNGPGQSAHHIAGSDESSWFSMNFWAHREDGLSPAEKLGERFVDAASWLPHSGHCALAFYVGFSFGADETLGEMVWGLYDAPRLPLLAGAYVMRREAERWHIPKSLVQGAIFVQDLNLAHPQYAFAKPEEEKQAYDTIQALRAEVLRLADAKERSKLWDQLVAFGHKKLTEAAADWHKFEAFADSGDPHKAYQAGIMAGRLVCEVILDILLLLSMCGEAVRLARLAARGAEVAADLALLAARAARTRLGALAKALGEAIEALRAARAARNAERIVQAEQEVQRLSAELANQGKEGEELINQVMPKTVEEAKKLEPIKKKPSRARGKKTAQSSGTAGGSEERGHQPNRKWRTERNGERGGKPRGERTVNEPNQPPGKKRAIAIENDSAEKLADAGYDVEQNPDVPGTTKKPDYRIEGEVFDCYAPEKGTPAENVVKAMNDKANRGQADRIVLNLQDTDITRSNLRDALNSGASQNLKEVIVIDQSGNIIRFYP